MKMKKIFFLAFCLIFITAATSGATSTPAPKISATPSSVNFGSVALGATPAAKIVTIKNTGTSALTINSINITGTDSAEFGQTGSCTTIAAGGSCPVSVTFTPALPYAKKTALLTIASSDLKKPTLNVKLSGQVPPPKISATPSSVNFGKLPPGKAISKKSVTVKNNGLSDLVINSIDIWGTEPGDFSETNNCGTVHNGGACTINVTFAPMVPNVKRSATLNILSNDPKKPTLILKLSGSSGWGKSTISLPKTGQTICYDASGSVIACTGTGQDGDLQEGVAWPSPRFTNNNNGTITDKLTGLMWTADGNAPGPAHCTTEVPQTWTNALAYVACLNTNNYLEHNDWRLPNINELKSLVNSEVLSYNWLFDQGFSNVQGTEYWSSTSTNVSNYSCAFYVDMYDDSVNSAVKTSAYVVWPVRTGQSGSVSLPKTGQTICYDASGTVITCTGTGQDGDLQEGVAWPSPRFTNNNDQTITDNLTGLMWAQNAETPGPAGCTPGGTYVWQDALTYVACLNTNNYLKHNDWRLPNVDELRTLTNYGQLDSSVWLIAQGFSNVQANGYWSSTTSAYYLSDALHIYVAGARGTVDYLVI